MDKKPAEVKTVNEALSWLDARGMFSKPMSDPSVAKWAKRSILETHMYLRSQKSVQGVLKSIFTAVGSEQGRKVRAELERTGHQTFETLLREFTDACGF